MDSRIIEQHEEKRDCGYRDKPGALYICNDNFPNNCGRLPIELEICPCCGHGIKPSRGWTWINLREICKEAGMKLGVLQTGDDGCKFQSLKSDAEFPQSICGDCPLAYLTEIPERTGLLWIGEKFYSTPEVFQDEVQRMGLSRKIKSIPRGFVIGETMVALAHRKMMFNSPDLENGHVFKEGQGIFSIVVPSRIEVICDGTEDSETIDEYEKRGLTPIKPIWDDHAFPKKMNLEKVRQDLVDTWKNHV